MYAVITAGGRVDADFARAIGSEYKALAPLGNARRLIDASIDAARSIDVAGIAVVGSSEVLQYCADRIDVPIVAAEEGVENIRRALHAFADFDRLVYLTSDIPFADGAALGAFVERSNGIALTMALASGDAYDAAFPAAPPHVMTLGRERIANGSAFVIDRSAIEQLELVAGRFFDARKSLPRLALLLGPLLCLRFALKRLDIATIERRARAILGVDARAIRAAGPGLCYDVDTLADWAYAHSFALADG